MGWTAPKTWNPGDVLSASDFNTQIRDNLLYLMTRPQGGIIRNNGSDYSTSSGSFVDIDGTNLAITFTPAKTKVLILFSGTGWASVNMGVQFDITVDGNRLGGTAGLDVSLWTSGSAGSGRVAIMAVATVTANSPHTFKVQWRAGGGTVYLQASTTFPCFSVMEIG